MDSVIENLKSTTFSGKRFTRKQIEQIQETVKRFPLLSRRELAHTLCEHLQWVAPNGKNCVQACLHALEELEQQGIFRLPEKAENKKRGPQKKITWTSKTDEPASLSGTLDQFMPVTVEVVTEPDEVALWNEFVDRYHYLGYRRPIGLHLRYFVKDSQGNRLGCLMFSYASQSLVCRDQWIGWDAKAKQKRLEWVINNNRFLLFPWVKIKDLASKVLALACQRLPADWETFHGYRPVLLETYVDSSRYQGTCYRAANWICIGKTAGKKASATQEEKTPKDVYIYPLSKHCQAELMQGKKLSHNHKKSSTKARQTSLSVDDPFVALWSHIIATVVRVADEFDRQWQKRQRVLNTLLLVLFVFRLVFSKNKQGYAITVEELWDQCRLLKAPLPQEKPVAASALCNARAKLDERIFKTLNAEIIRAYDKPNPAHHWQGHRLFAVDGTKMNLPRQLIRQGYLTPSHSAYYPQGLVSCLYQLKTKMPIDFELSAHADERQLALQHLPLLTAGDIVVYDRGYFSYGLLHTHHRQGIHAVFRIPSSTIKAINEFIEGDETDQVISILPATSSERNIREKHPGIKFIPIHLRLIKYTIADTQYIIGTTLLDSECYTADALKNLYHARWGIEELYKVSKELIGVEEFHSQSERGVKQELYAHFVLVTLSRIFANHSEDGLNQSESLKESKKIQVNMKNCLVTLARHLEGLFVQQAALVKRTINSIMNSITACQQKCRPNRSYDRQTRKPVKKWQLPGSKRSSPAVA